MRSSLGKIVRLRKARNKMISYYGAVCGECKPQTLTLVAFGGMTLGNSLLDGTVRLSLLE